MNILLVFHHQIPRIIIGSLARRSGEDGWEWSPEEEAIEAAGLWKIWEYVRKRKAKNAESIVTHLICKVSTRAERIMGSSSILSWW